MRRMLYFIGKFSTVYPSGKLQLPSCAVVERTVTGCQGELRAPIVKLKLFKMERK